MRYAKRTYVHVERHDDGWAIKKEGNSRVTSIHNTQREAIIAARQMAQNQRAQLVIHTRNGRVRARVSYGIGPFPPREPRKVLFPKGLSTAREKAIVEAVRAAMRECNGDSVRNSKQSKGDELRPPRR